MYFHLTFQEAKRYSCE